MKEQIHTFIHPFIHLNIYLSLENHWCFPHLQWRPNPGHWVKQMKSTLLSENMHTAVKWFEIIDLNCPQLVSLEDVLKITACARHTKTKKLEADVLWLWCPLSLWLNPPMKYSVSILSMSSVNLKCSRWIEMEGSACQSLDGKICLWI